jgi:hypothetical protein
MKRNWIAGVAATALLVAGAASAQTTGNGPAGSTALGSTTTDHANAGTVVTPAPQSADNGPATTSGNGSAVNGGVGNSNGAINTSRQTQAQPAHGANSFTKGEATDHLQSHGFSNVTNLTKDAEGVWRGQATQNGQQVSVWLDYKGNVGQGTAQQANQQ